MTKQIWISNPLFINYEELIISQTAAMDVQRCQPEDVVDHQLGVALQQLVRGNIFRCVVQWYTQQDLNRIE